MTNYKTTPNQPPAAVTIRIRKADNSAWQPCPLLASAGAWVQVDDGQGPLWVMVDHVNRLDWGILATFERLSQAKN